MGPRSRLAASVLFAASLAAPAVATAQPEIRGRRVEVPAADAQRFLQARFPQRHDAFGLLELTLSEPRLSLPPGDRLHLELDLALAAAGGAPVPVGRALLSSALRYDAAQQALFLERPRIEKLRPAGGGAGPDAAALGLLDAWAADYARTEPVYRMDPALTALLGGLRVETAAVEDGRLVLTFDRDVAGLAPGDG